MTFDLTERGVSYAVLYSIHMCKPRHGKMRVKGRGTNIVISGIFYLYIRVDKICISVFSYKYVTLYQTFKNSFLHLYSKVSYSYTVKYVR
jgi:hypothetical protein